jgi:hypothetical protein
MPAYPMSPSACPPPPWVIPDWRRLQGWLSQVIPDWRALQRSGLNWRKVEGVGLAKG